MKTGIILFILTMVVVFAIANIVPIVESYAQWCRSFGEPTGVIIFMAPFVLAISMVFGIVTEKVG